MPELHRCLCFCDRLQNLTAFDGNCTVLNVNDSQVECKHVGVRGRAQLLHCPSRCTVLEVVIALIWMAQFTRATYTFLHAYRIFLL